MSLDYLDKKFFQFIKLPDSSNKKSNRLLISLNIATFFDKDKKKFLEVSFSYLKLK